MGTMVKIKFGIMKLDSVAVKSGLRQGNSPSPILFNLVLKKAIKEIRIEP